MRGLVVLGSRHSRHPETLTLTTTILLPPVHLGRSSLILHRKPCGDGEKDESIVCLRRLTHEQPLGGRHIFLAVVELHNLIHQCFSLPSWRAASLEVAQETSMVSQQMKTPRIFMRYSLQSYKPQPAASDIDSVSYSRASGKDRYLGERRTMT